MVVVVVVRVLGDGGDRVVMMVAKGLRVVMMVMVVVRVPGMVIMMVMIVLLNGDIR